MKKIYESPFNSWDERAEAIIIYELEEGEYEKIENIIDPEPDPDEVPDYLRYDELDRRDELLESLGLYSDWGGIIPGARYTRYYIERLTTHHLIISRYDALNV